MTKEELRIQVVDKYPEIEKTYISKYEEFSEGRYKDYIFNVLDTYDFEQYIMTRFGILTAPVEYNIWIRKKEKKQ